MNFLADLPVLILGLGESGLAMARWCARFGARVVVWDSRVPAPGAAVLAADLPGATLIGLAHDIYGDAASPAEFARLIEQILRLNPQLRDPNRILAGGMLRIPPAPPATDARAQP